jgi:CPA1 family monovalent cation:H+ antiporter
MSPTLILIVAGVFLVLVSALAAIALKKLRFPYTLGLVAVGLLLSLLAHKSAVFAPLSRITLKPDLILYVLLPTLVFDAAVHMDIRLFFRNLVPIMVLALPGVVLATGLTGVVVAWLTPMTLAPAMLFGALISTTDPVAVIALFKEIGAPKRLTMLVDGESLLNDATAMVAFQIVVGLLAGGAISAGVLALAGVKFLAIFAGGAAVGAALGGILVLAIRLADDDPLIEVALTTVVAYAAFVIANYFLELSGVMAAVGAGFVVSWYGSTRFTPAVKQYLDKFWSFASFVANSLIFLILGITEGEELVVTALRHPVMILFILGAVVAITVARIVAVMGLVPLVNRLPRARVINRANQAVMVWGGLRGALPIALALTLPREDPAFHRQGILLLTLGVVMFTLLIQGTTISRLIRLLGLDRPTAADQLARLQALLTARRDSLKSLQAQHARWSFPEPVMRAMTRRTEAAIARQEEELARFRAGPGGDPAVQRILLYGQVFSVFRRSLLGLQEQGLLAPAVYREVESHVTVWDDRLQDGETPGVKLPDLPPTFRFEERVKAMLDRLAPSAAWRRRWHEAALTARYQRSLAMAVCARIALDVLPRLAEVCGSDPAVLQECRDWLEGIQRATDARFQNLEQEAAAEAHKAIADTLVRSLANVQTAVIAELAENGSLSEAVAAELSRQIRGEWLAARRNPVATAG